MKKILSINVHFIYPILLMLATTLLIAPATQLAAAEYPLKYKADLSNPDQAPLNALRGFELNPETCPQPLRNWIMLKQGLHQDNDDLLPPGYDTPYLHHSLAIIKAEALLNNQQPLKARERIQGLLKKPNLPEFIRKKGQIVLVESLLQEKKYKEALASLGSWPPKERKNAVALGLKARAEEGLGQNKQALASYAEAWKKSPPNLNRVQAAYEYRRLLTALANRYGGQYWLDLVTLSRLEWKLDEALALIDRAPLTTLNLNQQKDLAAQKKLIIIYKGRYEEGCSYHVEYKKNPDRYASCLERAGSYQEAAKIYLSLATGSNLEANQANAVKMLALDGDFEPAAARLSSLTTSKAKAEATWSLGLGLALKNKWLESQPYFEALANQQITGMPPGMAIPAKYFWARSLEESGNPKKAQTIFKELSEGKFGYYQILAGGRLQGQSTAQTAPAALAALMDTGPSGHDSQSAGFYLWFKSIDKNMADNPEDLAVEFLKETYPKEFTTLKTLLNAGLWEEALNEGERLLRSNLKLSSAQKTKLARLVWGLAAQGGRYNLALYARQVIINATPKKERLQQLEAINLSGHPLVYSEPVLAAYHTHDLPPQLTLALIKTESAWQDKVVSVANAQGLMQLLPATAAKVAQQLGEPVPDHLYLNSPELNIRYGSWYLASLIKGFNGQWPLALASYNGGPFNIKRWADIHQGAPLDVFLEIIPLVESRKYVKRIVEGIYLYELAYLGRGEYLNLAEPVQSPGSGLPDF